MPQKFTLYEVEFIQRAHADYIRRNWPMSMQSDPTIDAGVKRYALQSFNRAEAFERCANIVEFIQIDEERFRSLFALAKRDAASFKRAVDAAIGRPS